MLLTRPFTRATSAAAAASTLVAKGRTTSSSAFVSRKTAAPCRLPDETTTRQPVPLPAALTRSQAALPRAMRSRGDLWCPMPSSWRRRTGPHNGSACEYVGRRFQFAGNHPSVQGRARASERSSASSESQGAWSVPTELLRRRRRLPRHIST